ncbi:MAG: alpha/beta hydrolase [Alphaproteobacteria bacterium]|nr:alpha/beta hydrolase [Alphaproteobacteria bacterium]
MPLTMPVPLETADIAGVDGAVFRVRRHGNRGGVRLVVSHGNGFAADGYLPFWAPLLRDFEVVALDMRNHGHNPPSDPANHDYAHFAQDIGSLADGIAAAFGAKPTAGLFHSMAAQSALIHALDIGWLWEALVLFDPPNMPPEGDAARPPMIGYLERLESWAQSRRPRFENPGELARDYAATRAGRDWVAGSHELVAQSVLRRDPERGDWVLRCPPALESAIYRAGITLGLWPRHRQLAGPIKLIGGDPDRAFPAPTALSNRALARDGGFDYAAIPGTGHLLQLEQPQACVAAALDFLAHLGLA